MTRVVIGFNAFSTFSSAVFIKSCFKSSGAGVQSVATLPFSSFKLVNLTVSLS